MTENGSKYLPLSEISTFSEEFEGQNLRQSGSCMVSVVKTCLPGANMESVMD